MKSRPESFCAQLPGLQAHPHPSACSASRLCAVPRAASREAAKTCPFLLLTQVSRLKFPGFPFLIMWCHWCQCDYIDLKLTSPHWCKPRLYMHLNQAKNTFKISFFHCSDYKGSYAKPTHTTRTVTKQQFGLSTAKKHFFWHRGRETTKHQYPPTTSWQYCNLKIFTLASV